MSSIMHLAKLAAAALLVRRLRCSGWRHGVGRLRRTPSHSRRAGARLLALGSDKAGAENTARKPRATTQRRFGFLLPLRERCRCAQKPRVWMSATHATPSDANIQLRCNIYREGQSGLQHRNINRRDAYSFIDFRSGNVFVGAHPGGPRCCTFIFRRPIVMCSRYHRCIGTGRQRLARELPKKR